MAINKKAIKISKKHLLGIQDLSISDINLILDEAKSFITLNKIFFLQKIKLYNINFVINH